MQMPILMQTVSGSAQVLGGRQRWNRSIIEPRPRDFRSLLMPVTRQNITPLYEQIAAQLRLEIDQGRYEPAGLLPSETQLTARFGVSRVTVRLAVGQLVERGLVERHRGKGTFVKGKRWQHGLNVLRGFHDILMLQGLAAEMQLLRLEKRRLPASLRRAMRTDSRKGLFIERLHGVEGEPLALASTFLPPEAFKVTSAELRAYSSYAVIETLLGWKIERARLSVRVERASANAIAHLGMSGSDSALMMDRTSYLEDGRVCEQSRFEIRPDNYEFVLDSDCG